MANSNLFKRGSNNPYMRNQIFGLHAEPSKTLKIILGAVLFVVLILIYSHFSDARLAINPNDKILPSFGQIWDAFWRMATQENKRTGEILLWSDTIASMKRLLIAVFISAVVGLLLGVNIGAFKALKYSTLPFITTLSIIPPLSILPILFITFGTGEAAKIILIIFGTVFLIIRDITLATEAIPKEQITKALTMGASQLGVVYRVLLPQIVPKLLNTIMICLGGAWLFLIAAESIVATEGLGYRIFLVRRYLSMDIIIAYVMWITFIGFVMNYIFRIIIKKFYPWYK